MDLENNGGNKIGENKVRNEELLRRVGEVTRNIEDHKKEEYDSVRTCY